MLIRTWREWMLYNRITSSIQLSNQYISYSVSPTILPNLWQSRRTILEGFCANALRRLPALDDDFNKGRLLLALDPLQVPNMLKMEGSPFWSNQRAQVGFAKDLLVLRPLLAQDMSSWVVSVVSLTTQIVQYSRVNVSWPWGTIAMQVSNSLPCKAFWQGSFNFRAMIAVSAADLQSWIIGAAN